jgi:hypothetical protein
MLSLILISLASFAKYFQNKLYSNGVKEDAERIITDNVVSDKGLPD